MQGKQNKCLERKNKVNMEENFDISLRKPSVIEKFEKIHPYYEKTKHLKFKL